MKTPFRAQCGSSMKMPIALLLTLLLSGSAWLAALGRATAQPTTPAKSKEAPLVGLWIAWNNLASNLQEIDNIPLNKINATQLSFVSPLKNPDRIAPAIKRFHERGIKVITFVCMELTTEGFAKTAAARGESLPPDFVFRAALNADGTKVGKFGGRNAITSFWDPAYRQYMEARIRFLKNCGADFVQLGEMGYMTSDKRDFTEEALASFQQETGMTLPSTKLGPELADYLEKHQDVQREWFDWKYAKIYRWFATLGVDGVRRHSNGRGLVSPAFPGARIVVGAGGFGAESGATEADYAAVEKQIRTLAVPGILNLGEIQFSVGNTGANIKHPENIRNWALFLAKRLEGFIFYGSAYWLRYKEYVNNLPDLQEYPKSVSQ